MSEIDRFSGMIISMYCEAGGKHHWPHIHVRSGDGSAVYRLNGQLVEGGLPSKKSQEIQRWLIVHQNALKKIYKMAHTGQKILSVKEVEKNETIKCMCTGQQKTQDRVSKRRNEDF